MAHLKQGSWLIFVLGDVDISGMTANSVDPDQTVLRSSLITVNNVSQKLLLQHLESLH